MGGMAAGMNMCARVRLLLQAGARACCPLLVLAILEALRHAIVAAAAEQRGERDGVSTTARTAPACLGELHPALQVGHAAPHILAGVRLVHVPGRVHLL